MSVTVHVHMHAYMCVCVGFFWHGAATVSTAHCTQRTRATTEKELGGKVERIGGKYSNIKNGGAEPFWINLTRIDERCGNRGSNEEPRHHSFITGILQGAQLRRQKQRVGGTEEERKMTEMGTDGADRAGEHKNTVLQSKKTRIGGVQRYMKGRGWGTRTGDRMQNIQKVSSLSPQHSHSFSRHWPACV